MRTPIGRPSEEGRTPGLEQLDDATIIALTFALILYAFLAVSWLGAHAALSDEPHVATSENTAAISMSSLRHLSGIAL